MNKTLITSITVHRY